MNRLFLVLLVLCGTVAGVAQNGGNASKPAGTPSGVSSVNNQTGAVVVTPGSIGAVPVGVTFFAQNFDGADFSVKLNKCVAAAVAAGSGNICDASALGGSTHQTASQAMVWGDPNGVINTRLILPSLAFWYLPLNSPGNCAITQYGNSVVDSNAGPGGGDSMRIFSTSATNVRGLFCTDTTHQQMYFRAGGFSLNVPAGTVTNGAADIEQAADQSELHDMIAVNYMPGGRALYAYENCCALTFRHVQGYASNGSSTNAAGYANGGTPCYFANNVGMSVESSTCNAPGIGYPNVTSLSNNGLTMINDYMESNCQADTTTAMVINTVGYLTWIGGSAIPYCLTQQQTAKQAFTNGSNGVISVVGFNLILQGGGFFSSGYLADAVTGMTIPGTATSHIQPSYSTQPYYAGSFSSAGSTTPSAFPGGLTTGNLTAGLISGTDGSGVSIQYAGSGLTVLRSVSAAGWTDNTTAQFLQVGPSSSSIIVSAKSGTVAPRVLFTGNFTQFTNNTYALAPVPNSVLEVDNAQATVISAKINGAAGATADLLDFNVNGTGVAKVDSAGNITAHAGTNILYRCTTAGTLPVGALTITAGNCGATTDTGFRSN